jgi:hypothetical protein
MNLSVFYVTIQPFHKNAIRRSIDANSRDNRNTTKNQSNGGIQISATKPHTWGLITPEKKFAPYAQHRCEFKGVLAKGQ